MIPTDSMLVALASRHPLGIPGMQTHSEQPAGVDLKRREPFPAWSAIDNAKKKTDTFSKEASREFDIASKKTQDKTGKIEPWTPKYYAACIVGGMLACVCHDIYSTRGYLLTITIGSYSHGSYTSRSDQMPSPG